MRTFAERFYDALENQLTEVAISDDPLAEQYKTSILLCKKAMVKLKNYISSFSFATTADEVHFFKVVKPKFYSKYIFFINVYNFTMQRPTGSEDIVKEYINYELADLKRFFDHNHSFYQYYRSGSTQMDEFYFTRGGFDVHVELEDFEEDEQYSTSHDYKLSKIIANEKYQDFLNTELQKLSEPGEQASQAPLELPLIWTSNKTDLVELIYALVSAGVFNNGNAEVKSVVKFFETVYQIDLGQFYKRFTDITMRKKDRAVFLDKLKLALLRRIDDKWEEDHPVQQEFNFRTV